MSRSRAVRVPGRGALHLSGGLRLVQGVHDLPVRRTQPERTNVPPKQPKTRESKPTFAATLKNALGWMLSRKAGPSDPWRGPQFCPQTNLARRSHVNRRQLYKPWPSRGRERARRWKGARHQPMSGGNRAVSANFQRFGQRSPEGLPKAVFASCTRAVHKYDVASRCIASCELPNRC